MTYTITWGTSVAESAVLNFAGAYYNNVRTSNVGGGLETGSTPFTPDTSALILTQGDLIYGVVAIGPNFYAMSAGTHYTVENYNAGFSGFADEYCLSWPVATGSSNIYFNAELGTAGYWVCCGMDFAYIGGTPALSQHNSVTSAGTTITLASNPLSTDLVVATAIKSSAGAPGVSDSLGRVWAAGPSHNNSSAPYVYTYYSLPPVSILGNYVVIPTFFQ